MDEARLRRDISVLNAYICRFDGRILAKHNLTTSQAKVLYFLVANDDRTLCQKSISRCFGITHATSSGILRRLIEKGFVVETADKDDKRHKNFSVTPAGYEVFSAFERRFAEEQGTITGGLTERELTAFQMTLRKMILNISKQDNFF